MSRRYKPGQLAKAAAYKQKQLAKAASKPAPAPKAIGNGWMLESMRAGEYWLIARDEEQGYTKRAILFPNEAEALAWAEAYTPED